MRQSTSSTPYVNQFSLKYSFVFVHFFLFHFYLDYYWMADDSLHRLVINIHASACDSRLH